MIKQCTENETHQKVVTRHVWQDYVDEKKPLNESLLMQKENHGMRYTQLRGIERVSDELALKFGCMNLKKMTVKKWKTMTHLLIFRTKIQHMILNTLKRIKPQSYSMHNCGLSILTWLPSKLG